MEFCHRGFVFGTDRPDQNLRSILHRPRRNILHWVGPDRGTRQLILGHLRVLQHDARVERKNFLRRGQKGIDVHFLDPRLLDNQPAEANQNIFERGHIHRRAPAHSLQCSKNSRLLHQSRRKRRIERRERQGPVAIDLDKLSAGAE